MKQDTAQHRTRVAAYCRVAADSGKQDQTLAPADSDETRTALFNSLARAESEELERRFGRHICIMYMARRTG